MDNLLPLFRIRNRQQFEQMLHQPIFEEMRSLERRLATTGAKKSSFYVPGFCYCCGKPVKFLVDMKWGSEIVDGLPIPNWRERLECPACTMNNRQRLVAALIAQRIHSVPTTSIYFMEYVTPIYKWAERALQQPKILGSEYLGYQYRSGEIVDGVPHEDVMNLSFASASVDFIVSNDVFEHVPDPWRALRECARVLSPSGLLLATIPFDVAIDRSVARAELHEGKVRNIHPPVYHGNPVSHNGSLVFTDFGWDILDQALAAGFADVALDIYASRKFGHLGGGQVVFRMAKTALKETELSSQKSVASYTASDRTWDGIKEFFGKSN